MELLALNIQRWSGLQRVEEFDYIKDLIPEIIVDRLWLIYDSDLFIGGASDALLGPTLRCIVGDQCVRLSLWQVLL